MRNPKIIAIDFDGTLVTNKFPDIGEPIHETITALKGEQDAGAKVILWTCRKGEMLGAAINWCCEHEILLDAVNANMPEMIEFFGGDTRKIFANEYWDDRALLMPPQEKQEDVFTDRIRMEIVPWLAVRLLRAKKVICANEVFTRDYKAGVRDNIECAVDLLMEMMDEIDTVEAELDAEDPAS